MKKIVFTLTLAAYASCFAQITFGNNYSDNLNTVLLKEKIYDESKVKEIQGSAYIYENFADASIKDVGGVLKVRYNAYKDDMQIQQNGENYIIPRDEKFSTIKISNGEVIRLEKFDYKEKPYEGYLFVVSEKDGIVVYKKEKVEFKDFEKAKNSYSEETPPRFVTQKPEYFIKTQDGKIVGLPKNKKKLIELLPNKQSQIEAFTKNNKVDFGNEKNLRALFNAL